MSDFDDIRPYHDDEVSTVIQRVIADNEFIDLITNFRYRALSRLSVGPVKSLLRAIVRRRLRGAFSGIDTVAGLQQVVEDYMTRMIRATTDGVTVGGLDDLDLSRPHLFISNHRDITLDPAFTNYSLHQANSSTVRIAIGDNLLTKPYASDLMRLNKSFIVKRSISKPRELLRALTKLSRYIRQSLVDDKHPVWIAQREGRAKDGIDATDLAVLKMLFLAKPKAVSFEDYLSELRIVPVAISYEFDPCIGLKAHELTQLKVHQSYSKAEHEDLKSIGQGISGYKGRVHIEFGSLMSGISDFEALATTLDEQIARQYKLFDNNYLAYARLHGEEAAQHAKEQIVASSYLNSEWAGGGGESGASLASPVGAKFAQHIAELPASDQAVALEAYANPVTVCLERKAWVSAELADGPR